VSSIERNGAVFAILNNISDLILGCLCNFVIKPPEKIVIRPLYVSAFSDLVLVFGLFQVPNWPSNFNNYAIKPLI
jgi:hypothetical protein